MTIIARRLTAVAVTIGVIVSAGCSKHGSPTASRDGSEPSRRGDSASWPHAPNPFDSTTTELCKSLAAVLAHGSAPESVAAPQLPLTTVDASAEVIPPSPAEPRQRTPQLGAVDEPAAADFPRVRVAGHLLEDLGKAGRDLDAVAARKGWTLRGQADGTAQGATFQLSRQYAAEGADIEIGGAACGDDGYLLFEIAPQRS